MVATVYPGVYTVATEVWTGSLGGRVVLNMQLESSAAEPAKPTRVSE
jgi:hypothetical protein